MIRESIVIRDESKSNRIKKNKIKVNQNESIRIKNKRIRQSESEIKKKILKHLANQNQSLTSDSFSRIKIR